MNGNQCVILSLLSLEGESPGVNGLNVESQQPGDYSGDSKSVFKPILKYLILPVHKFYIYS